MGVRFACHLCGKRLHVKAELAGKRGICPACNARFRIPNQDAERSLRLEGESQVPAEVSTAETTPAVAKASAANAAAGGGVTGIATDGGNSVPARPSTVADRPTGLLESEPEAAWYVRPPSGGQYGPASSELLRRWIEEHRVAAAALLWREGWHQWRVAGEALPELVDQLPGNDEDETRGPRDDSSENDSSEATPIVASQTAKQGPVQDPSSRDQQAVATAEARLRGRWDLGAARRGRMIRRMVAVGMLFAASLVLVAVLLFVAFLRE